MQAPRSLYRFRPINRLLEGGELENQEIYFAIPDQLNDPMEGFRDIFWKGDRIVWKNLFRHYVLCVEAAYSSLCIAGEEIAVTWDHIPVFNYGDTSHTPQHLSLQNDLLSEFFSDANVSACIDGLASRPLPIRASELSLYLKSLHFFTLSKAREIFERKGLQPKQQLPPEMRALLDKAPASTAELIGKIGDHQINSPRDELQYDAFFDSQQGMMRELKIINYYNARVDQSLKNRNLVFFGFCDEYVRRLELLIFPRWYAACFSGGCDNASVWGSYGQGHSAVCLKFKTEEHDGRPTIRLNHAVGIGSAGIVNGWKSFPFAPIVYEKDHHPVDFFQSLRLPIPSLKKYWFSSDTGERSPLGHDLFRSDEEWRKRYWGSFEHAITRKLEDWAFEREYRLLLTSDMDFSKPESRKAQYEFSSLEGLIFGMRTPLADKLAISKIIEKKCRESGRADFKFYEARYSRGLGKIVPVEMPFLKFM